MVRWRSLAIGLVVSAVCLWLLLRTIDVARVGQALSGADGWWIALSVLLLFVAMTLRFWRWQLLFLPTNRVTFYGVSASTLVGYMLNTVLPGRVGELARAALLSQTDHVSTARVLGSILVEKIIDVTVLLILLGVLTAYLPLPAELSAAGVSAAVVFGAVAIAFFAMSQLRARVVGWIARTLDPLPVLRRISPSALADLVLGSADALRHPVLLAAHLVLAPLMWLVALGMCYAVMRAFGIDLPWTAPALVVAMTNLGMTVPSAPGYVGVYHYIATLTLTSGIFTVDRDVAAAFAVALHALSFGFFLIAGGAVLVVDLARQRYRLGDLWRWRAPSLDT
jgi:uncharacterized protein (TIRG00374 family)